MQITHVDGSVSDTEKLNDIDSMAVEKAKELLDLFSKYKIPFVLRYQLPGERFTGAFSYDSDKEKPDECLSTMMRDSIQYWERYTNGHNFVLMDKESLENLKKPEGFNEPEFQS